MIKIRYYDNGNKVHYGLFDVETRKEFSLEMGKEKALNSRAIRKNNANVLFLITIIIGLITLFSGSMGGALIIFLIGTWTTKELSDSDCDNVDYYNNSTIQP